MIPERLRAEKSAKRYRQGKERFKDTQLGIFEIISGIDKLSW